MTKALLRVQCRRVSWLGRCGAIAAVALTTGFLDAAVAAPAKPADRDFCVKYDSAGVAVVEQDGNFLVTSGAVRLHRFKKREQAEAAVLVAKHYDQQCFMETSAAPTADKPSIMSPDIAAYAGLREYWTGTGVGGAWPDKNYCFEYDPRTLRLAHRSHNYQIDVGDGDTIAISNSKSVASRLLAILREHPLCRINPLALPGDTMQYFR